MMVDIHFGILYNSGCPDKTKYILFILGQTYIQRSRVRFPHCPATVMCAFLSRTKPDR